MTKITHNLDFILKHHMYWVINIELTFTKYMKQKSIMITTVC